MCVYTRILEVLIHNRSLIMSRHGFLGTGQYAAKWLGEYDPRWEDFRRSIVNMVDMSMFGFQQAGSDMCGYRGDFEIDLCENWIKASALSPFMKMIVETGANDDVGERQKLIKLQRHKGKLNAFFMFSFRCVSDNY